MSELSPLTKDFIALKKTWDEGSNKNAFSEVLDLIARHINEIERRLSAIENHPALSIPPLEVPFQ